MSGLTAESERAIDEMFPEAYLGMFPVQLAEARARMRDRLAAIEAAAVRRALSVDRMAAALHELALGCSLGHDYCNGVAEAPRHMLDADDLLAALTEGDQG